MSTDQLIKKYRPLLEVEGLPKMDLRRQQVMAQCFENTRRELAPEAMTLTEALPANVSADFGNPNSNNTTNVSGYDPIMIQMMRRTVPNLIAFDVCGVQAMNGPTALIFAMRPKKATDNSLLDNEELFYNEADSSFSGTGTQTGSSPAVLNDATPGAYTNGTGVDTAVGEDFGDTTPIGKVGFTIEKVTVTAKERALEAGYTVEFARDLRNQFGADAETELANIIQGELVADINREVIRTIYRIAKPGSQNTSTAGTFDLTADSNGRWAVEKFKGLRFQVSREVNQIAKETRRGPGNILICSSDIASALDMTGVLDVPMDGSRSQLNIDDTGNTFVGVLDGRIKVYIDPYSPVTQNDDEQFMIVGYKGASVADSGLFYCPYVPLEMFKVIDPNTYQPKIMFKTRYGLTANPFSQGTTKGLGALTPNTNVYYRRTKITNLTSTA